tara:strand:- start:40 stop:192 length:153 start_codon:yes stop_codon:yes gene_type:complete
MDLYCLITTSSGELLPDGSDLLNKFILSAMHLERSEFISAMSVVAMADGM